MATIAVRIPRSGAEPIYTRPMLALSGTMVAAMSSFYLLFSAEPVHAARLNGDLAAGLATGSLMATTIVGELFAPRLIARLGRRRALMIALIVLALPSLAAFSTNLGAVLLSCAARGFGLGVLLVAACGLAAALAPPARRAEVMGIYGVASAIPAIACVPLGPWVLAEFGASSAAAIATFLGLVGMVGVALVPASTCGSGTADSEARPYHMPALRAAAWPSVALAIGAVATGVTVTFLPLAHSEMKSGTVMLALLVQGLGSAAARWAVGRPIDRHGPKQALAIGVVQIIAGLLCLAMPGDMLVLAGMACCGIGFGILQSASLAALLQRCTPAQMDGASALWNAAYDAGLGIGGLVFGMLAATMSYSAAFLSSAVALSLLACLTQRLFRMPEAIC
jgi:predicted MFS family arabinose efflux permease